VLLQLPPVLQLCPHAPQFVLELVMSVQAPLQFLMLVVSVHAQAPEVQVPAGPQSVQLEPQWRASLLVSAQNPPGQTVRLVGQLQAPLMQLRPKGQVASSSVVPSQSSSVPLQVSVAPRCTEALLSLQSVPQGVGA
jgi:hypothetical protein